MRIVFQYTVINQGTLSLIEKAEACSSSPSRDNDIFTDIDEGFYAILGSPNGGLAMHMLIDHKHDIGLRYVEKVRLLKRDEGWIPVKGRKQSRHFFFELSEPRRAAAPATVPLPPSESESESKSE